MDIAAVSMGAQTATRSLAAFFFFFQDKSTEVELLSHMAASFFISLGYLQNEDTHFGFLSEHFLGVCYL